MKFKKPFIYLIFLCMSTALLAGCDNKTENITNPSAASDTGTPIPAATSYTGIPIPKANSENTDSGIQQDTTDDTNNPINANQLYENTSLDGIVVEFTDGGCSVNPTITREEGDGLIAEMAVPGNEDSDTLVAVTYNDNCVFQIAEIDAVTAMVVMSDASEQDIKKQTSVLMYGDYQDTNHLIVSKVIIVRITGDY